MVEKDKQPSPESNEQSEAARNDHLNELALEAQRHIPGSVEYQRKSVESQRESVEYQRACAQLFSELRQPGALPKPKQSGLSAAESRQVSEDTRQETDLALARTIGQGKFDPKKGNILHLARRIQSKKHLDVVREHQGIHKRTEDGKKVLDIVVSADQPINNHQSGDDPESKTTYLDQLTSEQHDPSFLEKFREIVVENPDNLFSKTMKEEEPVSKTLKERKDVTLQKITLLWLDGYTWAEIAAMLRVKVGSVSSFFNRSIKNPNLVAQVKLYLAQFLFLVVIHYSEFWGYNLTKPNGVYSPSERQTWMSRVKMLIWNW